MHRLWSGPTKTRKKKRKLIYLIELIDCCCCLLKVSVLAMPFLTWVEWNNWKVEGKRKQISNSTCSTSLSSSIEFLFSIPCSCIHAENAYRRERAGAWSPFTAYMQCMHGSRVLCEAYPRIRANLPRISLYVAVRFVLHCAHVLNVLSAHHTFTTIFFYIYSRLKIFTRRRSSAMHRRGGVNRWCCCSSIQLWIRVPNVALCIYMESRAARACLSSRSRALRVKRWPRRSNALAPSTANAATMYSSRGYYRCYHHYMLCFIYELVRSGRRVNNECGVLTPMRRSIFGHSPTELNRDSTLWLWRRWIESTWVPTHTRAHIRRILFHYVARYQTPGMPSIYLRHVFFSPLFSCGIRQKATTSRRLLCRMFHEKRLHYSSDSHTDDRV